MLATAVSFRQVDPNSTNLPSFWATVIISSPGRSSRHYTASNAVPRITYIRHVSASHLLQPAGVTASPLPVSIQTNKRESDQNPFLIRLNFKCSSQLCLQRQDLHRIIPTPLLHLTQPKQLP